jgi:hypothetical protein
MSPARSGWIAPGRIGFMSTQRRENRPYPATKSFRGGLRSISNPMADPGRREIRNASRPHGRQERNGYIQIPVAQFRHVHASGTAAQSVDLALFHNEKSKSYGTPAALSLQSDCNKTPLAMLVPGGTCRGWSPSGARRHNANLHDIRLLDLPLMGLPIQSPLPILRASIRLCRGYRQP